MDGTLGVVEYRAPYIVWQTMLINVYKYVHDEYGNMFIRMKMCVKALGLVEKMCCRWHYTHVNTTLATKDVGQKTFRTFPCIMYLIFVFVFVFVFAFLFVFAFDFVFVFAHVNTIPANRDVGLFIFFHIMFVYLINI